MVHVFERNITRRVFWSQKQVMTKPGNTAVIPDTSVLQSKSLLHLVITFGVDSPNINLKTFSNLFYLIGANVIYNAISIKSILFQTTPPGLRERYFSLKGVAGSYWFYADVLFAGTFGASQHRPFALFQARKASRLSSMRVIKYKQHLKKKNRHRGYLAYL